MQVYVHKGVKKQGGFQELSHLLDLKCTTMTYNWSEFKEATI